MRQIHVQSLEELLFGLGEMLDRLALFDNALLQGHLPVALNLGPVVLWIIQSCKPLSTACFVVAHGTSYDFRPLLLIR